MAGQKDRPSVAETASDNLVQRLERLPPGHPSSPYHEDGTCKPPVTRSADRELPLPDEQGADPRGSTHHEPAFAETDRREATGQESRDSEIPPETSRLDRRSWAEAIPHLKEQWERHQDRWPQEPRPQIDRHNDEPGSWCGDSGRRLSARDNTCADARCDQIAKAEAQITTRIEETERASAGELAGKDYRLKGRDRLKDKIAAAREGAPGADLDRLSANIHDAVRYTLQYDDADYAEGVTSDVGRLKDQGFDLIKLKNFWNDAEYKGINSQWHDRQTGQTFEMQFHTRESFHAKQSTHKAYERLRNPQITEEESGEMHDYQRAVSAEIPIPIGAADISEYPRQEKHAG